MGVTTFDTLKFVRRLEEAGVPSNQAEAQAEVLTEAFNVNLEELVTKDYLATQFVGQKAYVDQRFTEQRAYMDSRFEQVNTRFEKLEGRMLLLQWMLGIVVVVTVIPFLQSVM